MGEGENETTSWLTQLVARVVLVLGLAYVSLWWSYQHFYSVFAISPDDVGLAPSGGGLGDVFGAVLRLGLWLSVALLALGLLPVACIGLALYAFDAVRATEASGQTEPENGSTSVVDATVSAGSSSAPGARHSALASLSRVPRDVVVMLAVVLALGLLACIFGVNAALVSRPYAGVVVAVVVVVAYVCWRAAVRHTVETGTEESFDSRWWKSRRRWLLRMSDLFLVIAVIGVLFVDLPGEAHDVAGALLKNAATNHKCKVPGIGAPLGRFRLDLLNVRGIPATFAVDLPGGLPSQHRFGGIYLGTANGWIVIYQKFDKSDKSKGRILRIPTSSGVSIIVKGNLPNCKGVH